MSREIKFRGKSKRTGQWIYGDLLTSPNGLLKYIVQKSKFNEAFLENLAPGEVEHGSDGEYTGLKDKKGVEIYEGDVLKYFNNRMEVVEYEGGGFSPFAIPGWEIVKMPSKVEVIGNIYENPELMEAKNV